FERCEMRGELEHGSNTLVARGLVGSQELFQRTAAPQPCSERLREHRGIDECVTDALRRNRISVVARVADERPSFAIRPAEVTRHARRSVPALLATAPRRTRARKSRAIPSARMTCP